MILKSIWRISLVIAAFGLLISGPASAQELFEHGMADEAVPFAPGGPIPGQYIVVLNDDVTNPRGVAAELSRAHGLGLGFTYSHALKGFSAQVPAQALSALSLDSRVAYVEENQRAFLVDHHTVNAPTGIRRTFADENAQITIDAHDDLRIDVDVAVIDTGIDLDHSNLNVVSSVACLHRGGGFFGPVRCTDGAGNDGYFHGSHVAGTIGALDNGQNLSGCGLCDPSDGLDVVGMAPGARLHAVKVFNDQGSGGTTATVLAGIDWVAQRASTIEVANMSLGFDIRVDSICQAMADTTALGVIFAVSAGNGGADGIGDPVSGSPADCTDVNPDMFVVSALKDNDGEPGGSDPTTYCGPSDADLDDTLADFSNFGDEVNIIAPGTCIVSTYRNGGYGIASGTSMASPHVAGAAALLASGDPCDLNPVASELPCAPTDGASVNVIVQTVLAEGDTLSWIDDSPDGKKEPLLDVSNSAVFKPIPIPGSEGGGGGGNSAPVAIDDPDITTTEGLAVTIDVLFNDEDNDNDLLTIDLGSVTDPSIGSVGVNPENTLITYTPAGGGPYTDTFTYKAYDGTIESSNFATVTVNVQPSGGGLAPVVTGCTATSLTLNPGDRATITVIGSNFQDGATVDLGERIAVQNVTFLNANGLSVQIRVHNRAASGPRNATVTNPDTKSHSAPCFTVI